ncbi:hypothetical protein CNEO4_930008 [Clostridium neonatale]|nr:hypothetical protein CNEO4_930008 [Clostridium neonatale]
MMNGSLVKKNKKKMKNKFKNIQIIYDLNVFDIRKFLLIIQGNKK